MAVTVLLELQINEVDVDKTKQLFKETLGDTRAYAGFIDIEVFCNQGEATNLVLVEKWESREAYESYVAWRRETGFFDRLEPMLAAPPSIRYFDPVDA